MTRTGTPAAERKRPDWALWLALPKVQVWQAVALSLEIEPDAMTFEPNAWLAGPGAPTYFTRGSFVSEVQAIEFKKRRRIAAAELAYHEDNDGERVPLAAFVKLALKHQWPIPDELRGIASQGADAVTAPALAQQSAWPWGSYETELLRHLAAAADKWWMRFDPDDPTTAPTNATVIEWLRARGVAHRVAEVMAQILRADGLPAGPRR